MATYFHGSQEIQPDGLQTLYLMNPGFVGYSDAALASTNMVLLNSPASSLGRTSFPQSNQTQHLVGIPLQAPVPSSISGSQELSAVQSLPPRVHYNVWTPTPSSNSMDRSSQLGISLGLSRSGIVAPNSNGGSSLQSALVGSKYLKVAQQLLDEVVNVGKGVEGEHSKGYIGKNQVKLNGGYADEIDTNGRRDAELTVAEKQELQMKKVKLANMFDEVEQRYRHYHHQMQMVVSSFEAVAGYGAATTYTSLALQTISKQFRCLRDAISGQIRAASKCLGEDFNGVGKSAGSRLRFVDHQLRQQRALQQLGVMQNSAWRPQRGLPERAVTVLRAWLFEHFLHPYPKDTDKHMLAKQTGLTRSQVSNWFINARVRLWKPMVEEMYLEETKEHENKNSVEKSSKRDAKEESSVSKSSACQESNPGGTEKTDPMSASGYDDEEALRPTVKKARTDDPPHFLIDNLKLKERSNQEVLISFEDRNQDAEGNDEYPNVAGYGSYSIGEIGRFDPAQFAPRFFGNGFSLSLGLPHSESISVSGAQPSYISTESTPLGRRLEMSSDNSDYSSINNHPTLAHTSNTYGSIKMQRGERFAAQLLPDFVA